VLASFGNGKAGGTLSDRLNPDHRFFDGALAARWRGFSKRERAAIVARDQEVLQAASAAISAIVHPFDADDDDHCESPVEAYRDIVPLLERLARTLGLSAPGELRIYDPYYCAGACVRHLGSLGFERVYNRCEDFYATIAEGRVPEHDVVVTNPPYSGEHPQKLLRWCRANGKPFLLLMPNYFCAKPYYEPALGGTERARAAMLYLCPRKRYAYWTPKGLRKDDKVQKHHKGAGGNRTSPFISFWFVNLAPALPSSQLQQWWTERGGLRAWTAGNSTTTDRSDNILCSIEQMPHGVRPANGRPDSKQY